MVADWSEPAACVKCGEKLRLGTGETVDERMIRHLRDAHGDRQVSREGNTVPI